MKISFVIPAHDASRTLNATLRSVYEVAPHIPAMWDLEVIVVDDGSRDRDTLKDLLGRYPRAVLLTHDGNRGMCASRNTGISESQGDIVVILDADDVLVPGWPEILQLIVVEWPAEVQVCFAAARTPEGRSTASEPEYCGLLTEDDLLNERHAGEYLPLFRGSYIRRRRYVDLGTRKSCGILSYLTFAQDGPFWITPRVLRVYHDDSEGSVSSGWATAAKARETVQCYDALMARFAAAYRHRAPRVYCTKRLRLAIYRHLAGEQHAWDAWRAGASWHALAETVTTAMLLLLKPAWCSRVVTGAKHAGLIRRYG
jgi:glycosyltransferase involved in cell wall biosynthesis